MIGAVALTLAVVVILPMVLDSEPKITGKDIDLSIPAPDKVGEFVPRVPVSEVAVTLPLAGSSVVASPAPPEAVSAVAIPAVAQDAAKPIALPSQQKQAVPSKAQPTPHEPSESQKSTETHKSTETGSADKPVSAEGYIAQVGAYANPDTAKQELKKLKKWGFRAYTEKVGDKIAGARWPLPGSRQGGEGGPSVGKTWAASGGYVCSMTGFDFAVIAILLISVLLGLWRGLVCEVLSLVGWPLAFVLSNIYADNFARLLPMKQETLRATAAYVLMFFAVLIMWGVLVWMLSTLLKGDRIGAGRIERWGGLFGVLRGGLVVLALVWLAGLTGIPEQPFWRKAMMSKTLEDAALLTKAWLPDSISQRIHYGIRN